MLNPVAFVKFYPNRAKNRLKVAGHLFLSDGLPRIAGEFIAHFQKRQKAVTSFLATDNGQLTKDTPLNFLFQLGFYKSILPPEFSPCEFGRDYYIKK
jgi:hypothetical protein